MPRHKQMGTTSRAFSLSSMNKTSRSAVARSKSIDQQLDEERSRRDREIQLLILGPSGAGKSTFLKQVRLHLGDKFPDEERQAYHEQVLQNVATGLVHLMELMDSQGMAFGSEEIQAVSAEFRKKHPRVSFVALAKKFREADDEAEKECPATSKAELTKRQSLLNVYQPESPAPGHVLGLWADRGMQACYTERLRGSWLTQAEEYFLPQIERICQRDYIPSIDDILNICWPTLGIQEHICPVDTNIYRMIDVAGQRSMRKKWIHFFEDVVAVLFFVSVAAFDEPLEEDATVNSMQESLHSFQEVCSSRYLARTEFILFLNKNDLLPQKLASVSISDHFPSYTGDNSPESCISYFTKQFTVYKPANSQVYTHASCAINVTEMGKILKTVVKCISDVNVKRSKLH